MTSSSSSAAGTLYIVSTPIGNLGDITRRAVEVLRAAHCVVAEDTRRTRALLSHLEIAHKELRALNAHGSDEAVEQIVLRLERGEDVAYVTDAGTPAVSDPGRALVASAAARRVPVRVVPGPSAVTAAVALSGLVEGPFLFLGFLPRRGSARQACLERLRTSPEPVVIFEAPPRMAETLVELAQRLPERRAFVGRELTKLHEEGLHGTLTELAARTEPWRGEIVFVVDGAEQQDEDEDRRRLVEASLRAAIECGANPSHIARALAEASGWPRRQLYQRALELQEQLDLPRNDSPED
ncbi:MAG: 16S rRNA (cytidine(1402)-2'-O)-methyltransferase [Deltaproteobacteria bacterium]